MNILFTCAGRRSYSIAIFKEAVKGRGKVFACDASAEAPALREADQAFVVPRVDDAGYVDALVKICKEQKVGLVIPALEPELAVLAAQRSKFNGTKLLVSSPEITATCYDKLETARFLESCGVTGPRTYLSLETAREALASGEVTFPLVVKPRWGVSSIGTSLVEDDEELELTYRLARKQITHTMLAGISATDPENCILIQERAPGEEYGLDIINDLEGRYVCTFAKRKIRMWAGNTDRAVTVKDHRLEQLGKVIGENLRHVGILDCDVFLSEKGCIPVDLNPRLGGGYPFSHLAGANLPAALVAWANHETPEPQWLQIKPEITGSKNDGYIIMTNTMTDVATNIMTNGNGSRTHKTKPLHCQVAIIGAGPYGLAAAAHLRDAKIETCVFGEAMEFWAKQMPAGMFVRSTWEASQIANPRGTLSLEHYSAARNPRLSAPLPLDEFVNYGRWYQEQAVPDLDPRRVTRIESASRGFRVMLADGDSMRVERVVVAAGISRFARRPSQFDGFPSALVSHSSEHRDLGHFAGRRVVVIGSGQSAVESSALLSEVGADVEIISRHEVHWLDQKHTWLKSKRNPLRPFLYPPTDVGPPGLNLIVATPGLFMRLPRSLQERVAYRSTRPAASGWLKPRVVGPVRITGSRVVTSAKPDGDRLKLKLDDGSDRLVDHVFLASGFSVDISRYPFLAPELVNSLDTIDGYPILKAGFEASVPGLHFLGAPAARSFGPVCRFVSGTRYCGPALARRIAGKATSRRNFMEQVVPTTLTSAVTD